MPQHFLDMSEVSAIVQHRSSRIIYKDTHRKNFKLITMRVFVFSIVLYWYFKMGVFSFVDGVRVNLALY
jgi:hypothetical protein